MVNAIAPRGAYDRACVASGNPRAVQQAPRHTGTGTIDRQMGNPRGMGQCKGQVLGPMAPAHILAGEVCQMKRRTTGSAPGDQGGRNVESSTSLESDSQVACELSRDRTSSHDDRQAKYSIATSEPAPGRAPTPEGDEVTWSLPAQCLEMFACPGYETTEKLLN
mmetsp:Transcript_22524/g.68658  ORF Transcript_22524/g.68658 Transcript_22524/m.68658 type:complete len:164 (-) Transcript_22524:645-1136(-)